MKKSCGPIPSFRLDDRAMMSCSLASKASAFQPTDDDKDCHRTEDTGQ